MPLIADVDGVRVVSLTMPEADWSALKAASAAAVARITMACGRPGCAKTSPLGTPFFAHLRTCGDCGPETPEHMAAKAVIVSAATQSGWTAEPEAAGDGWVADVLCTQGPRRVVFEVQWSRQQPDDYAARQARYAAAGLRCAWFARHTDRLDLADPDVPVFALAFADRAFTADLGGRNLPMADAVAALLGGRVRHRTHLAGGSGHADVGLHACDCWKCGKPYAVWQVLSADMSGRCGLRSEAGLPVRMFRMVRPEADREVWRAAASAATAQGLAPATLEVRASKMAGARYQAFCCPHCGAVCGDNFYAGMCDADPLASVDVGGAAFPVPRAHWCLDSGAGLCDEVAPGFDGDPAPVRTISPADVVRTMFGGGP